MQVVVCPAMSEVKKEVYNEVYGSKKIAYDAPQGFIGFLYKRFRRFEENRDQVALNLLPTGKEKILDVGCGCGDFIFMAKDGFSECYGVDISSARIEVAKQQSRNLPHGDKFHFSECNVDDGLPFEDCFFDVVSCVAVIEHVFNPPRVLDEIKRVLKSGGFLVVQVPNFAWLPNRVQLLLGKLPTTGGVYLGSDWEHLHNFTKSILCKLLVKKGFEIDTISCSGVFSKYRKWWLSVVAGDFVVKAHKK